MIVTKHGETSEIKDCERFKCNNCNCEFECNTDEYYIDYCGAETPKEIIAVPIDSNISVQDYYVCSCPECHKIVKKVHTRIIRSSYMSATPLCDSLTYCGSGGATQ